MKTNKEYPATHSMETAWYCVDEEGNVGIFDIDQNGPKPALKEGHREFVDDVIWDEFPSKSDGCMRSLPLTVDQIKNILVPKTHFKNKWEFSYGHWTNFWWSEIVVKIDVQKTHILKEAITLSENQESTIVCLSKEQGWYYLCFAYNKAGVKLLESNKVVLEIYDTSHIISSYYDDEFEEGAKDYTKTLPVFLYTQGISPRTAPAIRTANPNSPLKISQLPEEIQRKMIKLPVRFKEKTRIQLADFVPVCGYYNDYVYNGKRWGALAKAEGGVFYYNNKDEERLSEDEMKRLLASGEAEKYDYHKHNKI